MSVEIFELGLFKHALGYGKVNGSVADFLESDVERDPRRHIMAEHDREKLMLHLSQSMVWL